MTFDPFVTIGSIDESPPFVGDPIQSNRLRAVCQIFVSGFEVTASTAPYLVSVRVMNGAQLDDYNCEIQLDDRDGSLPLPGIGSPLQVLLGWVGESSAIVFEGQVLDIEHGCSRSQGGRMLWIHGQGADWLGDLKTPMNRHWGEGAPPDQTMGSMIQAKTMLSDAFSAAGASLTIHPSLASIARDYWSQQNESAINFGRRFAQEHGALFRIINGNQAEITVTGENADGSAAGTTNCVWGQNLISWRVRPMSSRPAWNNSNQHYYDTLKANWNWITKATGLGDPWGFASSAYHIPAPAPNAQVADQQNSGAADDIIGSQGPGRIMINGEPTALGNGYANLVGARPGVDGQYWIRVAEHIYSRQGYVTWLDVLAQEIVGQSGGTVGGAPPPYTQAPPAPPTEPETPETPTPPT